MTTMQHGSLTIRRYAASDEQQILATFNTVFRRECGDDFVDRDLDYWRWQYLANPAGTQILLAVDSDGTVASQYAAIPQTADTTFGPRRFVHVVDSMTHPKYRQALQREGLFALLGREFTADYSQHGNELGYGFPVRIAERIGSRLLDYRLLRRLDYLLRPCRDAVPTASAAVQVEQVGHFPAAVDELWQRCLPAQPCAVRKDRGYLQWRYVQIPTRHDYVRLLAWRQHELVGLVVLRPQHQLVPGSCSIVDWVCHEDDDDTARCLLVEACRIAQSYGRQQLMAVAAGHSGLHRQMTTIGAALVPSSQWMERRLTFRITGPYLDPELLATRWQYLLGDTDLC